MISFPNCKINIGLAITGKREDGFHNLESIFYPVPYCDILEILPAEEFSFGQEGYAATPDAEDNLCVKAYRLLEREYDLPPVAMFLYKKLPSGAGLGGGSADAAFTLKCLNDIFQMNIETAELEKYAGMLGSDCPFFIRNVPAFVQGRGEIAEPLEAVLKGVHISIIHPGIHISTAEAFKNIRPKVAEISFKEAFNAPLSEWQDIFYNDFEKYAFAKFPEIENIKKRLKEKGAVYTSMSGSGSAVYGLSYEKLNLENCFPGGYTLWQGVL